MPPEPGSRGPPHFLISRFRMGPAVNSYQTLEVRGPLHFLKFQFPDGSCRQIPPDPEVRGPHHILISRFRKGPSVKSHHKVKKKRPPSTSQFAGFCQVRLQKPVSTLTETTGPHHFLISSFRMGPAVKSYQTLKSEGPTTF